ncbi:alpha/beta fold hydrolase [Acidocella aminolytica]|jgi:pimeloyl-ACP methyl ester carboxylesterase|nr:alpha/beta hydrolase [Acidocella aminolytica]GBQ33497.1 putative hydrolase [Acidocella aminolytica 101 = DSM 11237]SHE46587.1 Pimeloyl-ACP methyl ester carboxylesterase [Acidocella aminolytica 101 = DSM 11237]
MPYVSRLPGIDLAYEFLEGEGPVVMFCPGYASDMQGTKALTLEEWCRANKRAMLRFDYAGHGQSAGVFTENGIGDWAADAEHVLDQTAPGRDVLLVGSSMGGWISLLLGPRLGERLRGMVLIAPAPDFTESLLERELTAEQAETLERTGVVYQPSEYGDPLPFSLTLVRRSTGYLVMKSQIGVTCPVRILHGMQDASVPWQLSLKLVERLAAGDVQLIYIKEGDHRLSAPDDLILLTQTVGSLLVENGG